MPAGEAVTKKRTRALLNKGEVSAGGDGLRKRMIKIIEESQQGPQKAEKDRSYRGGGEKRSGGGGGGCAKRTISSVEKQSFLRTEREP